MPFERLSNSWDFVSNSELTHRVTSIIIYKDRFEHFYVIVFLMKAMKEIHYYGKIMITAQPNLPMPSLGL